MIALATGGYITPPTTVVVVKAVQLTGTIIETETLTGTIASIP